MNYPCPQCGEKQLNIQPADDSNYQEVKCLALCGYRKPLKHFNKKKN